MEKCYYFGKTTDASEFFYSHTMCQVISINMFITGFKYNSKSILVPRCKSCFKKHTKFYVTIFLPSFIIALSIVFSLFYSNQNDANSDLALWVGIFIISCIISGFLAGIISKLMKLLFFERIFKIRKEDDIREFEPIKKLLLLNWQFYKKDPSVASIEHIAKDSPYYENID